MTDTLEQHRPSRSLQRSSELQKPTLSRLRRVVWIILLLLIADRARLLAEFGFRYTDNDQAVLWLECVDTAHGMFHEPCFYGQSYNPALESWLGAPLYKLGLPVYIAMPLTTCLLSLLPFVILASMAYTKKHYAAASCILLIPIALPLDYNIVAVIPRGFVTGLAVGVFVIPLLTASSWKAYVGAGIFTMAAMTANPNVAIVLCPIYLWAIMTHWRRWRWYLGIIPGLMIGGVFPLGMAYFYQLHPTYDLHKQKPLEWTWANFQKGWTVLDPMFGHFLPSDWPGWIVLALLGALALVFLLRSQWKLGLCAVLSVTFLIATFGLNRIYTSRGSVWLSYSRMYLGIPIIVALFCFWLSYKSAHYRRLTHVIIIALITSGLLLALVKNARMEEALRLAVKRSRPLEVMLVTEVAKKSRDLALVAKAHQADLVIMPSGTSSLIGYALPALEPIDTLIPSWERRTWRLEEETARKRSAILILINDEDHRLEWKIFEQYPQAQMVSENPRLVLVKPEGRSAIELCRSFGISIRKF